MNKHYWAMYYGVDENLPNKLFWKKIRSINKLFEEHLKKYV